MALTLRIYTPFWGIAWKFEAVRESLSTFLFESQLAKVGQLQALFPCQLHCPILACSTSTSCLPHVPSLCSLVSNAKFDMPQKLTVVKCQWFKLSQENTSAEVRMDESSDPTVTKWFQDKVRSSKRSRYSYAGYPATLRVRQQEGAANRWFSEVHINGDSEPLYSVQLPMVSFAKHGCLQLRWCLGMCPWNVQCKYTYIHIISLRYTVDVSHNYVYVYVCMYIHIYIYLLYIYLCFLHCIIQCIYITLTCIECSSSFHKVL